MIPLPSQLKIKTLEKEPNSAQVEIFPLYPGYGHTIGNSLRRVLLSSLEGAGVTAVKIDGADHEFMTLPHIKEEVLEIILNLKQLNLKLYTDEPAKLILEVKGKKQVKASSFKKNSNVEIVNPDQFIATLTHKDAELKLEATVEKGLGFSPSEEKEKGLELGLISVDTVFLPIKSVGYIVKDVRVGKRTDYDKLVLNIKTDGTIDVTEAIRKAAGILVGQFNFIFEQTEKPDNKKKKAAPKTRAKRSKSKKDKK
jgi:DNA-directed RNA polymerase subunit alpha